MFLCICFVYHCVDSDKHLRFGIWVHQRQMVYVVIIFAYHTHGQCYAMLCEGILIKSLCRCVCIKCVYITDNARLLVGVQ